MWPSYTFHYSTRILNSTQTIGFNFFRIIYVAMSKNQFSSLDNIKMNCQTHKYYSFLQTYYKEQTCLRWHLLTLNMKLVFLFGNLKWWSYYNDSFDFISPRYTIKFTKHKWTDLLIISDTLICLWILVFKIGIIECSNSRSWCFWLYFSSLHNYWPSSSWNALVHTSWCGMERC